MNKPYACMCDECQAERKAQEAATLQLHRDAAAAIASQPRRFPRKGLYDALGRN